MLPRLAEHPYRRRTSPNQITHRLMGSVRHPDRNELAGAVQFREHECISAVGLDLVAGSHRDQRGRNDRTVVTKGREQAMKPIAARAAAS